MYPKIRALWALAKDGWLVEEGWFRSFSSRSSVNAAGEPIPWINYSMLHFLIPRIRPTTTILEYGGGSSTLFWARRVREVVTVEHDRRWAQYISGKFAEFSNINLLVAPAGPEYERAPEKLQKRFDLAVVDGIRRFECAERALSMLTQAEHGEEGGCILLDDSHLAEHQPIFDLLESHGYKALRISGAKPIQNDFSEAAVFYRPNNMLKI